MAELPTMETRCDGKLLQVHLFRCQHSVANLQVQILTDVPANFLKIIWKQRKVVGEENEGNNYKWVNLEWARFNAYKECDANEGILLQMVVG